MEKDKIEVGEYVRTRGGNIQRVLEIKPYYENDKNRSEYDYVSTETFKQWKRYLFEEIVTKHSKNIIDLIEVGDFVGKCEIEYITKNENGETLLMNDNVTLTEKDINSIVTKEQFKEMEYRV